MSFAWRYFIPCEYYVPGNICLWILSFHLLNSLWAHVDLRFLATPKSCFRYPTLNLIVSKHCVIFFSLFRAIPAAYGSSKARGRIRAAAASLHHSLWQCQIFNPLSGARDWTLFLMDTRRVHYCWATTGTPHCVTFDHHANSFPLWWVPPTTLPK